MVIFLRMKWVAYQLNKKMKGGFLLFLFFFFCRFTQSDLSVFDFGVDILVLFCNKGD